MDIYKAEKCEKCNGKGEVSTMEPVYQDDALLGPVGMEKCDNCLGTGKEPDEDIVVERIIENLTAEQEEKLQEEFADQDEGTLDDDMPDAFETYLGTLNLADLKDILFSDDDLSTSEAKSIHAE